jgi:RNA polymerase sigma factor (sigma-70 family)
VAGYLIAPPLNLSALVVVMRGVHAYDRVLVELLDRRGDALQRTAVLLAGSRDGGQDLLQAALERVLRSPSREPAAAEGHLRRTMYHLAVDGWRVRRRRREVFIDAEPAAQPDTADHVATRRALLEALAMLPPRTRAVLVVRFFDDYTVAETAEILGCSTGTVKSTTSRGLDQLRAITSLWPDPERTSR